MVYIHRHNGIEDSFVDLCTLKQKGRHVYYRANNIIDIASAVHRYKL
jgi:hypothetical protein